MKWGTGNPSSTELYRDRTAANVPISLRRKRCACGKVLTAKQLQQYGACASCVRTTTGTKCREAA